MIRVLVHGDTLDEGEQHHLRVRRAEPGDLVELRDGRGLVGVGRLARRGKQWSVAIESREVEPSPPPLVLAIGAGHRDRFGWLVEKAAELGVTKIVPIDCERTASVGSKLRPDHIERLQQRAIEATKQSGAAWAPIMGVPTPLAAFAADAAKGTRWLADIDGDPPSAALDSSPITVVIGPEGGFTAAEREALIGSDFAPIAFGQHILRFETAAIAAAVAISTARHRGRHG